MINQFSYKIDNIIPYYTHIFELFFVCQYLILSRLKLRRCNFSEFFSDYSFMYHHSCFLKRNVQFQTTLRMRSDDHFSK